MADKKRDDDNDRGMPHPGAGPAARTPQEDHTPRQEEQHEREARQEQRGQGRRRQALSSEDKAARDKQQAELRAGWAAASIGAQVVLDFNEDGSLKEPRFILDEPEMAGRQILLAGDNFGAGSSREHAPWALTSWGIRAILSTSFADIFRSNSLKNGLLPIVVEAERHRQLFDLLRERPDAELTVDLDAQVVHLPGDEDLPFEVDPFAKHMLLAGTDELGYLLGKDTEIAAWEAGHPARVDTLAGV